MTSSIVFSVTAFFRSFHTVNGSSNHGTRRTVCHLSEEKKSVHTALNRTSLFLRNEKNKKKTKNQKVIKSASAIKSADYARASAACDSNWASAMRYS
jgi:hypothetical protein